MQLPHTLPGEAVFSRIVRYLSIYGEPKERCLNALVGNRRAVVHPYLTAHLSLISRFTNESASELYYQQTLRPWFAYYLPKYQGKISDCSMGSIDLTRACQLATFRERHHLTVKYCALCAIEDIENFGVAYWHCKHQVPGVDVCSTHAIWLSHFEWNGREHLRAFFFPVTTSEKKNAPPLALQFAQFAESKLKSIQERSIDSHNPSLYKHLLAERDFVTNSGRLRRIEIMGALYAITKKVLLPSNTLGVKSVSEFRYVSSLIDGIYPCHPFKHLLLDFFINIVNPLDAGQIYETPEREQSLSICEIESRCCDLLHQGTSMAKVGRDIGKSRCYVKAVAFKFKIPVNLKPTIITDEVKLKVTRMAYKGVHRTSIAQHLGISSGSVEMIISSIDGLVEWRKKCKTDSKRRRYKREILRYFQKHPLNSRQNAKEDCVAAFFWLYTHNKDWLEQNLPAARQVQHVDRVNWYARDKELSQKVRMILDKCNRPITRTELDGMLGSHGWLISKKNKLPLTLQIYSQWAVNKKVT